MISLGMPALLIDAKRAEGAAFRLRDVVSIPSRTESQDIGVDAAYSASFSIRFESLVASTWLNLRLFDEETLVDIGVGLYTIRAEAMSAWFSYMLLI